ncbi:chemotaxis protein CheB [Anthocerotibacter panamensis]|uniref:chemotaxis protein CheB n=1 Tax=Anthocerotibacter panamensis TaxID=2857077 RepID=UPI001C404D80|nr:chemotaxis protein CheB [Anthocerotibacter panamensis]
MEHSEGTTNPVDGSTIEQKVSDQQAQEQLIIVGVGASAGGLEAFTQLLSHLPNDTGMAFVLIQHLDPTYQSMLPEILSRATSMSVQQVKNGMQVEPNHIYIIPPNTKMSVTQNILSLTSREKVHGRYMPIDYFFNSLAQAQGNNAIGVVLSGSNDDGTLGLEAIKNAGGVTLAQDTQSSQFENMPYSPVAKGLVDFILPPHQIAEKLAWISRHFSEPSASELSSEGQPDWEEYFLQILTILRVVTKVDFTQYKRATIERRILRRLLLHNLQDMKGYIRYLQDNPQEVSALYYEILINVTSFFRNPEVFEALKSIVFPNLVNNKSLDNPIRIWVPGCSTGEEVYSIAISLYEFFEEQGFRFPVQIFATDINERALDKARNGIYNQCLTLNVLPERIQRFFTQIEGGYQISKSIRELCVFAKHNLSSDPPFSNLDLVSCRNVLIYLSPALQKQIMQVFHFALKPTGYLLLGPSETAGEPSDLFFKVNGKCKIYARKIANSSIKINFSANQYMSQKERTNRDKTSEIWSIHDVQKEADQIILSQYSPAGFIINNQLEVLHFRGKTSPYISPAPGKASLHLLKIVHQDLLLDVRTAIHQVQKNNQAVQKKNLQIREHDKIRYVDLDVLPFKAPTDERYFLVLLKDSVSPSLLQTTDHPTQSRKNFQDREINLLRQELSTTKEHLQSIIEEQEGTNQDLKAANEEILSSNEELQSINEELETAKEEIQASNEELNTINDELNHRNQDVNQINNDLQNLIDSVNIPILILSLDLCIRRFTPTAGNIFNLIPGDVGRPFRDIKINLHIPNLEELLHSVVRNGSFAVQEIQDSDHHWYDLRIRPYQTMEGRVDGAIIMLIDIDLLKRNAEDLSAARDYAAAIVETIREPLIVLNQDLRVQRANRAFYEMFQLTPEAAEQQYFFALGQGQWNIASLREYLAGGTRMEDFEVTQVFDQIGQKTMLLRINSILNPRTAPMILLAITDITERKQFEQERRFYYKQSIGGVTFSWKNQPLHKSSPWQSKLASS